jgi:Zn-finger protein
MEALQWAKAGEQQRKELQVQAEHFPAHLSERLQIAFCWCLLLPLLLFTVTGQLFY